MATVKLVLDQRNKNAKKFPLVIRVSHKSKWKYIPTAYKLTTEEWNENTSSVQAPFPNIARTNAKIQKKKALILIEQGR